MKKIFTILSIVAVAASANAQNLITNPTFDNGLNGWTAGPTGSYGAPTLVTNDGHTGNNSAQYQSVTATTGFYQEVPVTAGTTYTISFWYKATGDDSDARIWSVYKDASGTIIYQAPTNTDDPLRGPNNGYLPTASAWTQHSVTVTVPTGATIFQMAVRAYNNATVAAFDDFSVTSGSLAVGEVLPSKYRMIKNTFVKNDEITFGADVKDVKVYTLSGQLVKTSSVKAGSTLNVAELQEGNYIVTGTVNNQAVSQKILKN